MNFISKARENWKLELIAGGPTREEVKIQRGIFQGDSPSSLSLSLSLSLSPTMFLHALNNKKNALVFGRLVDRFDIT